MSVSSPTRSPSSPGNTSLQINDPGDCNFRKECFHLIDQVDVINPLSLGKKPTCRSGSFLHSVLFLDSGSPTLKPPVSFLPNLNIPIQLWWIYWPCLLMKWLEQLHRNSLFYFTWLETYCVLLTLPHFLGLCAFSCTGTQCLFLFTYSKGLSVWRAIGINLSQLLAVWLWLV